MRTLCVWIGFLIIATVSPSVSPANFLSGGPYSIEPLDINGGGTTSTGGVYEISASTAQHGGVGPIAAGPYEFEDGFWAGVQQSSPPGGTPTATPGPGETPTPFNYDVQPMPTDMYIDARDLLDWLAAVKSDQQPGSLLFDFSRFWEDTFPPGGSK